jgi:hypothetical protein
MSRTPFSFVLPFENPRATGKRAMTFIPCGVPHNVLSRFPLPLGTLAAVRVHEPLDALHIAVEVATAAQVEMFRTRSES